jgi:hypothetical protein
MKYLSFDLRALALMRISIAIVIILDLSIRISNLELFYSDTGVFPLSMLFQYAWNPYYFSIHTVSGLWQFQLIIFLLSYFCAGMMLLGFRTRLFTFLSWVLMLSLHNRNGLILQGGDDLLRMVLFWSIFIPWGNRYSCDRLLNDSTEKEETQICTVATIAYLLQVIYLYTGSALLKEKEWNSEYSALYYAYSLDQIAYPITKYIYYYPELLKKLTFVVYYFELLVPVLFFIPIKHAWFRFAAVLLIIFFHALNSLTLLIGLFPLIGIATVIGMFPAFSMDRFEKFMKPVRKKISWLLLGVTFFINHFVSWKKQVYVFKPIFQKIQIGLLIFLIVFVFDWNFSNISFVTSKIPDSLRFIGYSLRLDQCWGMFAPGVFKDDGWYIVEGSTDKGDKINLLDPDKKLNFNKPKSVVGMFENDRWRKYSENYLFDYNEYMRGYFCSYCKRVWNEKHPDKKVNSLRVIYMKEFTLADYKYSVPQMNVLWEYNE